MFGRDLSDSAFLCHGQQPDETYSRVDRSMQYKSMYASNVYSFIDATKAIISAMYECSAVLRICRFTHPILRILAARLNPRNLFRKTRSKSVFIRHPPVLRLRIRDFVGLLFRNRGSLVVDETSRLLYVTLVPFRSKTNQRSMIMKTHLRTSSALLTIIRGSSTLNRLIYSIVFFLR